MAAPEANFLVLLFWVAMAALLIVLIAMGSKTGAEGACAIRQGSLSPETGCPEFPIVRYVSKSASSKITHNTLISAP